MQKFLNRTLGVVIAGMSFLAIAFAQSNQLIIYSPDTGGRDVVYWGPVQATTTATSTATTSVIAVPVVPPVCVPVMTTFNKYGDMNPEVAKLQKFLNDYHGANLNMLGYFGPATMKEVKNLQYNYGIKPTGAQYELTTALINSLGCGQTVKRERVVYTGGVVYTAAPAASVTTTQPATTIPEKVDKTRNSIAKIITDNLLGTKATKTELKGDAKNPIVATNTATKTSITDTLKKELSNVKENYKSYIVIFLLVLALFWFLKKTATE